MRRFVRLCLGIVAATLVCGWATTAGAVPFPSPGMGDYLLIGMGDKGHVGTSVAVSASGELGRNSVPVPMTGLVGSVPALPANAATVYVGTGSNGDIAITHTNGNFDVRNVEIWGETGIDCAGSLSPSHCTGGNSNSEFNGSNLTNSNGLNENVDLMGVIDEIVAARTGIPSFTGDHQITLTFNDGKWDSDLTIILASGVTVYDIVAGGNDLLLENVNLLIDGPADSYAIFRIHGDSNFKVSNSNMLVGDSGIGMNNVLFYTDKPDTDQHINVNNAVINGIAFWDLGLSKGEIHFDNVQGCSQVVADKVNLNNVKLNNCGAFTVAVPEPGAALLLTLGLTLLGLRRRVH